jgi:excisionase family DNA binding protein
VIGRADPPLNERPPIEPFGEPLIDAATVAAYLSIDPATVYRMAQRAELPGVEVAPRVLRFRPADVRAYVERRTRKAAPCGRVKRLLGGNP